MRKTHIEYLKAMMESVEQKGEKLFASKPEQKQGKFLETYPPLDLFQRLIPLCVINAVKCNDSIGNYRLRSKGIENLSPIYDADGNKVFRKLQIHAEQEFTYLTFHSQRLNSRHKLQSTTQRWHLRPMQTLHFAKTLFSSTCYLT